MKTMAIIGIIISSFGLVSSFWATDTGTMFSSWVIYGFFLASSIVMLKGSEECL